jgi:predicted metal-dependent peptidase
MTEPTITCPKCKTEIKLTESLATPLIESTRKQYDELLTQKDSDVAKRAQVIREKEKLLADEKIKLDEQVANQVEEQLKKDRARIARGRSEEGKNVVLIAPNLHKLFPILTLSITHFASM